MLTARGMSLGIGLLQTLNTVLCKCVLRLGYSLHTTRLSLRTSFDQQAAGAVLDMEGDEGTEMKRAKSLRKWYVWLHDNFIVGGMIGRVWGGNL